jgi:hypothetical protein
MPLPVNFEKLVKLPKANGYPHSIRAVDLMRNFAYCELLPGGEQYSENGLWIDLEDADGETSVHPQRRLVVRGNIQAGGSSFAVAYWVCEIIVIPGGDAGPDLLISRTTEAPDNVIYFHNGAAYLNQVPDGFPAAGQFEIINVPIYNPKNTMPFPEYPWNE